MPANPSAPTKKIGLSLLTALVVDSIVERGIFELPQNMAVGAGAGAIVIGWVITGIGMLMLAFVYQMLAVRKPEIDSGIYSMPELWRVIMWVSTRLGANG